MSLIILSYTIKHKLKAAETSVDFGVKKLNLLNELFVLSREAINFYVVSFLFLFFMSWTTFFCHRHDLKIDNSDI